MVIMIELRNRFLSLEKNKLPSPHNSLRICWLVAPLDELTIIKLNALAEINTTFILINETYIQDYI